MTRHSSTSAIASQKPFFNTLLAQIVAAAYQRLEAFAATYRPDSPGAREDLDRARELARHAVEEARRAIAGLRPTVLDDFGLGRAVQAEVEALRAEGQVVTWDTNLGPERLPPAVETTLFHVAQEGLANVANAEQDAAGKRAAYGELASRIGPFGPSSSFATGLLSQRRANGPPSMTIPSALP